MTLENFKKKIGVEKLKAILIDGHLYSLPSNQLDINKNIAIQDLKGNVSLEVFEFYGTFVLSKDGTICPHGLPLIGNWTEGFALDLHTTKSTMIGVDEFGKNKFETMRPPIAEDLFQLKYRKDSGRIEMIASQAAKYLEGYKAKWQIDVVIAIPPSDQTRQLQPVYELAKSIGKKCGLLVDLDGLKKIKSTMQLKGIVEAVEKRKILEGAFYVEGNCFEGKNVLLFDDLYSSGETLKAATDLILKKGNAQNVYVLTITKTRSKR